jgi:hypothetical protein
MCAISCDGVILGRAKTVTNNASTGLKISPQDFQAGLAEIGARDSMNCHDSQACARRVIAEVPNFRAWGPICLVHGPAGCIF